MPGSNRNRHASRLVLSLQYPNTLANNQLMPASQPSTAASFLVHASDSVLTVSLSGDWSLTEQHLHWHAPKLHGTHPRVVLDTSALGSWDSSLPIFVRAIARWCQQQSLELDDSALPLRARELGAQFAAAQGAAKPTERQPFLFASVGLQTASLWDQAMQISHFVGELTLSAARLAKTPKSFRWRDCLAEMQQCGVMALPIVSLISFLVGVTLAYTAATILRMFGGDIWVADLVGLSVTREMAAVMTAVVLAGRTGAAFAAQLANMKANEEIDALRTLGVAPVDFLVMPRILALAIMTPLLTLYAIMLGILGGMLIALGLLSIPPTAYWVELISIVDLSDVTTGLIKASTFGVIIGLSGCLRGLQAERSAEGVGKAATSSVVTAILLMVLADAFYAVLFNILGW